jgi:manganese/zinc/iron transport system permease protein
MIIPDWLWIIIIGSLVAVSCSLVGTFLVLRRMAMLGDAISHAVLPGIAVAFLLTGSRNSWIMLVGAAVVGVLTAFSVQILSSKARVRNDAAIGVTFTALFALGVILISRYASKVDLDTDCVLYGVLELTPLNTLHINGVDYGPMAFWQMLVVFVLTLGFVITFFKELKLTSFDPALSTALGINALVMHYALMAMVSVVTVGSFEPVGAILVVAMIVVPPATAYLWTHDLKAMLWLSALIGVFSATAGYFLGLYWDASVAGTMTMVAGVLFVGAFFLSPTSGLLTKRLAQRRLGEEIVREDALQVLWRAHERHEPALSGAAIAGAARHELQTVRKMLGNLSSGGLVQETNAHFSLTPQGEARARELVHRHRVYESYLDDLGYPADHQHDAADRAEHFLSPELIETIDEAAGNPTVDPHGREIPH